MVYSTRIVRNQAHDRFPEQLGRGSEGESIRRHGARQRVGRAVCQFFIRIGRLVTKSDDCHLGRRDDLPVAGISQKRFRHLSKFESPFNRLPYGANAKYFQAHPEFQSAKITR